MNSLVHKPVANRRRRPHWAVSESSLNQHFLKSKALRRMMIARMYWIENKSAREIAEHFAITIKAIERVIDKLR